MLSIGRNEHTSFGADSNEINNTKKILTNNITA